jgi:hypothetical protein
MPGGYTALMRAAMNGHVNVVQYLVEVGANLEAADPVSDHFWRWSMLMSDMVIDAGWIHSIVEGCLLWSCECGTMVGGSGSEPRGSRQGECSCGVGVC